MRKTYEDGGIYHTKGLQLVLMAQDGFSSEEIPNLSLGVFVRHLGWCLPGHIQEACVLIHLLAAPST